MVRQTEGFPAGAFILTEKSIICRKRARFNYRSPGCAVIFHISKIILHACKTDGWRPKIIIAHTAGAQPSVPLPRKKKRFRRVGIVLQVKEKRRAEPKSVVKQQNREKISYGVQPWSGLYRAR
jgi:hypothetical protein